MKKAVLLVSALLLTSCGISSSSSASSQASNPSFSSEVSSSISSASSSQENPSSSSSLSQSSIAMSEVKEDEGSLPARYRTWYQLLVYSFADGNNDGVGDFKGIVDKLDYLRNLGIGGIWLSPIHEAASYHSYDVKDYYSVNSKYTPTVGGVKYDLKKLLEECHKRDIKVSLDLVLNHSSTEHPWYYRDHKDWYTSSNQWYFGGSMPEFNYDVAAVRTEMKKIGAYWIDQGVDGFRLDAAYWIYNQGQYASKEMEKKTIAWWKEFSVAMKAKKSDFYLIGEVLTDENQNAIDMMEGLDTNFNFERIGKLVNASKGEDGAELAKYVASYHEKIKAKNSDSLPSPTLSNHDIGRYINREGVTGKNQIKMANGLMAIMPGGAYIYYGDELGMTGSSGGWQDMSYRTPMPWTSGQTNPSSYYGNWGDSTTLSGAKADVDAKNDDSIYAYTAKVINFKNKHHDLYTGTPILLDSKSNAIGALKIDGKRDYAIIFNSSDSAGTVSLGGSYSLGADLSVQGNIYSDDNITFSLPSKSIAVFEIGNDFALVSSSATGGNSSSIEEGFEFKGTPEDKLAPIVSEAQGKMELYFFNGQTKWDQVNCYAWVDDSIRYLGNWPGTSIAKVDELWYKVEIPHGASNVIFNNGSKQTIDLSQKEGTHYFVPTSFNDKISGVWYSSNPLA